MLHVPLSTAKIKKLVADVATPGYKTTSAAGFDLAAADDHLIEPGEHRLVGTGLVIAGPGGHALFLTPRSSLFKNTGLIMVNAPGIIDEDYRGPEDEVKLSLYNITQRPAEVNQGDRLAQGIFLRFTRVRFDEALDASISRGGFGSTGV